MIRSFFGIPIPEDVRKEIYKIITELKRDLKNVKWVEEENLHITLKFLGNIEEKKIEEIREEVKKFLKDIKPFEVQLQDFGVFPSKTRARVLWIGMGSGKENVAQLNQRIEESMERIGFKREKREFSPHLTIGRIRNPSPLSLNISYQSRCFKVNKFILYKSELSEKGPKYFPLLTFYIK